MGGILGFLGKKNVDTIIGGAVKGIDKLIFTNEEKAEFNKAMADSVVEFTKSTLGENTARSLTRRYVTYAFVGTFLVLVLGSGAVYLIDKDYSMFLFDLSKSIFSIVMMIAAFFYGGYYAGKFIGSEKKKK